MLSLEEFHARYDGEKPYFEYWDGEAVQKCSPDVLHSLIQTTLLQLLNAIGYIACPEVTLKLDRAYEPIPDVIAVEGGIRGPYPTEPFEVVIEVLMPRDSFSRVMGKCRLYANWGIRQIVIVEAEMRLVMRFENGALQKTDVVARRGERVILTKVLWAEVDRHLDSATAQ